MWGFLETVVLVLGFLTVFFPDDLCRVLRAMRGKRAP